MAVKYLDRIEVYKADAWVLNADGSPYVATAVTNSNVGVQLIGIQDFTAAVPEPRVMPGVAQGTVQDTFILPSITARKATFHTLYDLLAQNAALMNVKQYVVGDWNMYPMDTDQEGLEPTVIFLVSALIAHDDNGNAVWSSQLYPRAHIMAMPMNAKFDASVGQFTYVMTWAKNLLEPWGALLTLATNGALKSGIRALETAGRPNFGIWQTDGTLKDFLFDTNRVPIDFATATCYDYSTGLAISVAPASIDALGVHFTVAPATGKHLIVPYIY